MVKVVLDDLSTGFPVWAAKSVNTKLLEVEKAIGVVMLAFVDLNRARIQRSECEQVFSKEFFF